MFDVGTVVHISSIYSCLKNTFAAWELRVKTAIFVDKIALLMELGNKCFPPTWAHAYFL